ncbi:myosin heavy chain, non-muscle-like isoform X3 [Quillaja saponaria]|uniref:Myosin heavy chain, non-muscle-like isoform X3 n=1 Tax=Quillaja saponaria TaxID=32244 RepID=A0AAD7KWW3_QUISA|nr:myosin heavy chain, non-muscle-like isoform X3 [Quillaja saponaria]
MTFFSSYNLESNLFKKKKLFVPCDLNFSAFHDVNQQVLDATCSAYGSSIFQASSNAPVNAYCSSMASDHGHETPYKASELGTTRHGNDTCADPSLNDTISELDPDNPAETIVRHGELN